MYVFVQITINLSKKSCKSNSRMAFQCFEEKTPYKVGALESGRRIPNTKLKLSCENCRFFANLQES